jgi:hypothetical protein
VDEALRDAESFRVQHEGWTDGDTGRDGDTALDFHETIKPSVAACGLAVPHR